MDFKKIYEASETKKKPDFSFEACKDRLNDEWQKYVCELRINSEGQVKVDSFQDFLSKQTGRKVNFHTNKEGKIFWELTEDEWEKNDYIQCTCIGYRIKETQKMNRNCKVIYYIFVNEGYNADKERFDTSAWNKNVRAYRANVAKDSDPDVVELAGLIMRCWNKTKSYVQSGEIYKSWIMKAAPDGEFHKIGATLDLDRLKQMARYLEKEVWHFEMDEKALMGKRVSFSFTYGRFSKVTIVGVVAPMVCDVSIKIER